MNRANQTARMLSNEKIAFYFTLALVFIRFSMIHQILEYQLHMKLYILYMFGIPVFIGILATNGTKRAFRYRPAVYWTAFALWLIPSSLFSTWQGGSFTATATYYRTEIIILFAVSCLVTTWPECRLLLYTIAVAAVVNIASVIRFGRTDKNGRTSLGFGTVSSLDRFGYQITSLAHSGLYRPGFWNLPYSRFGITGRPAGTRGCDCRINFHHIFQTATHSFAHGPGNRCTRHRSPAQCSGPSYFFVLGS
jgi:hypothetical protein